MAKIFFRNACLAFFLCPLFALPVNAQFSKADETLKQLEAAGQVKRTGNVLEFKVEKPADTIQLRKKYESVFKNPNGGSYQLKFSVDPAWIADKKNEDSYLKKEELQNRNDQANNQTVTNSNLQCFSNIAVFGDSRQREGYLKYQWQVPPGITKIKIEAWSGGGDGFSLGWDRDSSGNFIYSKVGSGGGGGAYTLAVIEVKPGDKIEMNIPGGGGGKNLLIQVNDILNSLLVTNGSDGDPGNYGGKNGFGGHVLSQNIRGVFAGKTVWVSGENGLFTKYHSTQGPNANSVVYSSGVFYFGDGGGAAKLNNGGRGARNSYSTDNTTSGSYINSTNGGFPGGGGGAGFSNYNNRRPSQLQSDSEGRGAPGQVIIYY